MLAFLFPGQGTLRVGMGAWLRGRPEATEVFDRADRLLDTPVGPLCARGPAERLVATENAQPAVTVCGLAALAVLRAEGHEPGIVAGHSVGELAALHAAGALSFEATLRLVATRARLMAAVTATGSMTAVLGLNVDEVEELVARAAAPDEPLVVGLENAADHVVVSGATPAVDRLVALATAARKTTPLTVSNAFHSPLMADAVDAWAEAVRAEELRTPRIPVLPNVTAEPTTDPAVLRDALVDQLTRRVRWARTMTRLAGHPEVELAVEVGDSKVLTGLARPAGLRCLPMSDPTTPRRLTRERTG
ncbi:ACP S-malonyltransferase [Actinoalloteichus spitiensis]|uniref:ACP S-malonyltransferase n=1 Tax=Actinoalloteichus spitiensis TaxID=252394 RepID=UPI00036DAA12|nr:ACP S-malonyltransferase [Actinoalloteichus spitiensis]